MKLDTYLQEAKLTEAAFAGKVGCSVSTINRIRRGLHRPDWPTMEAISTATAGIVTPNDFIVPPSQNAPAREAAQ